MAVLVVKFNLLRRKSVFLRNIFFVLCLGLFYTENTSAQDIDSTLYDTKKWDLIYRRSRFTFNAAIAGMSAHTTNSIGPISLDTRVGYTFYGNINYMIALNRTFGLELGVRVGAIPFNYQFDATSFIERRWDEKYFTTFRMFSFPIHLIMRTPISQNHFAYLKVGMNWTYFGTPIGQLLVLGGFQNEVHFIGSFQNVNTSLNPNLSLQLGMDYILGYGDILTYNVVFNYTSKDVLVGDYHFFPGDNNPYKEFETIGKYGLNGTYLGVEIGYSFTKAGKKTRQNKRIARKWRKER